MASSSGRQPNFAVLNRGRHLCSAGRPSRWALAHIPVVFITLRVRHSRRKTHIDHGCLCVCLSLAAFPHHCIDPDVTWGNGRRGCPLVVHYWADLQSLHRFRCYDNIAPNAKCQRVLALAPCMVITFCVSRRRRKMYCGHARLCVCLSVCLCVSAAVCSHYCTDPDVTWGSDRGWPLVVHY